MTAAPGRAAASYTSTKDFRPDFMLRLGRIVFFASLIVAPWGISRVAGLTLGDALTLGAALIGIFSVAPHRPFPRAFLAAAGLIVLACLVLGLSIGYLEDQVGVGVRMFFVLVLIPFAAVRFIQSQGHLVTAALCYATGAAVSSIVALGQFLGVDLRNYFLADAGTATARFAGLNFHPNGQAGSLAIATAFVLVLVGHGIKSKAAVLLAVVNLAGLAIAASVTGVLAVGVALIAVLVRAGRFRLLVNLGVLSALGVLAWVAFTALLPGVVTPFDRLSGGLNTGSLRLLTVEYALEYIRTNYWGGVGFQESAAGTYDNRTQVHNMFVLAWYQGGAMFLMGIVLAIAATMRMLWRRAGGAREAVVVASLTGIFYAQTGPALYDRFVWVPIALLVAAEAMRRNICNSDGSMPRRDTPSLPRPTKGSAAILRSSSF